MPGGGDMTTEIGEAMDGTLCAADKEQEAEGRRILPRHWTRYVYPAPLLIILAALIIFPILYALRYSFYDYYLTRGTMRFVGLQNYVEAFQDQSFGKRSG